MSVFGCGHGLVNEGEKHEFHCRRTFCGEIISRVEANGVEIRVSGHRSERDRVDPEVKDTSKKGPKGSIRQPLHQKLTQRCRMIHTWDL